MWNVSELFKATAGVMTSGPGFARLQLQVPVEAAHEDRRRGCRPATAIDVLCPAAAARQQRGLESALGHLRGCSLSLLFLDSADDSSSRISNEGFVSTLQAAIGNASARVAHNRQPLHLKVMLGGTFAACSFCFTKRLLKAMRQVT